MRMQGGTRTVRSDGRWRILCGAAVVLAAAALGACGERGEGAGASSGDGVGEPRPGGTAVLCSEAAAESLNPFVSPDQAAVDLGHLVFASLVRYDDQGEFVPYLAESWEWASENTTLRLRVRTDLRWHDGAPVTAEDVAWTLNTAADPEYGYWAGSALDGLREATALDSATVVVAFSEPFLAGVEPFVQLPILPRHLLGDLDPEAFPRADYHRTPVGSGPYSLAERRSDGTLLFHRANAFPPELGRGYLDRIVYRPIPEPTTLIAELRSGGADVCVTGSGLAERLRSMERLDLDPLGPPSIQVLVLDTRREPFGNPQVRRAFSAALDRSAIASVMSPLVRPAGTPLPESSPWHDPRVRQPDADTAWAAAALDSAGWRRPPGGGVRRDAAGRTLGFTIMAPPPLETPLTVVQSQMARLGIEVELRFVDWPTFVRAIQDPDQRPEAMALAFSHDAIVRPDLSPMLHSRGQSNLASYENPAVDSLLDVIGSALDEGRMQAAYLELQEMVARHVPMLYTVYVPRVLAVGPRVRGVEPDINGPFASVASWWIPANE